ncbi:uncharacterized protein TRUGW13939_10119 [Talaromyces rugulosus]|uniref:DNA primase n=1 Tax=Talaromyces rugulosus TaxID=121627 RepID=A0A7H8RAY1_TALRU|nr:uncharacterized protein TRUGW13939_10119 [Talaromyces rugulosus]QKX62951.1 hypothetical protein TRUGW13939_10119 [Talaromyces rugulosus]
MPHSVSSNDSAPHNNDEEILPDAPSAPENESVTDEQKGQPNQNAEGNVKLEDLFANDDDDDDEFPASSAPDVKMASSPPPIPAAAPKGPSGIDAETMLAFYQRLFPFRTMFQWLNHGIVPSPDMINREFAVFLQNEAVLRYQSYATVDLFRKEVLRLNPTRFEIGPVYTTNPRDRKSRPGIQMKPIAKELVFDIDMTDYDDVRTCCSGAQICQKCWAFITMAIKVIDGALREDFGFEHILWVYSGRRGAHAWVGDLKARQLPDDRRKAIAGYLEIVKGNDKSGKRVNLKRPLHPHIARSVKILEPHFNQTTLIDQDVFVGEQQAERLLSLIPDKKLSDALRRKWDSMPDRSSANKWNDIVTLAQTVPGLDTKAVTDARYDIVLEYTYPRLDAEVSKKMIHLLKSPFVVHPGTGRICVPIDGRAIEEFNPLAVPTVTELLNEIDEYDAKNPGEPAPEPEIPTEGSVPDRKMQDYEKTRLKPYVDYFRSFVANLMKDERSGKRERGEEPAKATTTNDAMEF